MHFWETKKLTEMNREEWESLCDGCGKCCLHKLENEKTGKIAFTNVACKLLKLSTCRCSRYEERTNLIANCLDLKKLEPIQYHWLPTTCAYRLLEANQPLPSWHPLISGNNSSVKHAGVSISSYAIPEKDARNLEDHIIPGLN